MLSTLIRIAFCLWTLLALQAAEPTAVGLVLEAGDSKVLREGVRSEIGLGPSEFLFPGDKLITGKTAARVAHCPAEGAILLKPESQYFVTAKGITDSRQVLVSPESKSPCVMPQISRKQLETAIADRPNPVRVGTSSLESLAKLPAPVRARLTVMEQRLTTIPRELVLMAISRASLLMQNGLPREALLELQKSNDKRAVRGLENLLKKDLAATGAIATPNPDSRANAEPPVAGKTWALLIGMSQYPKLPKSSELNFADDDAIKFSELLKSPVGGSVPDSQIIVLTNNNATTGSLREAFQQLGKKAGKDDTVIVLIAGHGQSKDEDEDGFLLTYDSTPQNFEGTAIRLREIGTLVNENLAGAARVLVFIDICKADKISTYLHNRVVRVTGRTINQNRKTFVYFASSDVEPSYEGVNWGGGHGAFTYFVMDGWGGKADGSSDLEKRKDNTITAGELKSHVDEFVKRTTDRKQNPKDFTRKFAYQEVVTTGWKDRPAFPLGGWSPMNLQIAKTRERGGQRSSESKDLALDRKEKLEEFRKRLDALENLKPQLNSQEFEEEAGPLRVELEDRGQQLLIRYLEGEETPPQREDYEECAQVFEWALSLDPESSLLESKVNFCKGRMLIFDQKQESYVESLKWLENSIRLNPEASYAYNALGINHLENGRYESAAAAFEDAIRLAPHWAYAYHNLALTQVELGKYEEAVRTHLEAIRMGPEFAYLPYSLGLLYQRLNQKREAEEQYGKALAIRGDFDKALNALGLLYASSGKFEAAEKKYNEAMEAIEKRKGDVQVPRHNLGLLLVGRASRAEEGIRKWRENGSYPPSQISLAQFLGRSGKTEESIAVYREVLQRDDRNQTVRIEMAKLLSQAGKHEAAIEAMQIAVQSLGGDTPAASALVYETWGDLYWAAKRWDEARARYATARTLTKAPDVLKRLEAKRKRRAR